MSYIILTAVAAVLVPVILTIWSLVTSPLTKIPVGPGGELLFGHMRQMRDTDTGELAKAWSRLLPFGIFRSRFFLSWRVYITEPNALKKVLVTSVYDYPKPAQTRNFLTMLLGQGVLVAEGLEHKKQRRALDSAFSLQRIKEITAIFWGPSRSLTQVWRDMVPSTTESTRVDVMPWLSRCTLDIIGQAGFDYNFDSLHTPDDPMAKAYNSLFNNPEKLPLSVLIFSALADYFPSALTLRNNLPYMQSLVAHRKIVEAIAQDLLNKKRSSTSETDQKDILSILVRDNLGSEDPLTDREITDQCLTFLAAGHETTSTSLTWTLLRLAENQDVQKKLREEILKNHPKDEDLTYDQLNALPYLGAVTREVLRMDSPVPITARVAVKDDILCGYQIPKGSVILIPPVVVHYHPDIWGADADKFDPERFLEPGRLPEQARGPYANLTFLAGPRNCIGHKFAITEMKALLVGMIREFSFEEDVVGEKIGRRSNIVMRPKSGHLFLKMKRINA